MTKLPPLPEELVRIECGHLHYVAGCRLCEAKLEEITERIGAAQRRVLRLVVNDYDRRRSKPWGRFLLWLLRKTT